MCDADKFKPGCYAVKVNQDVSAEVAEIIRENEKRNLGKLTMEENP